MGYQVALLVWGKEYTDLFLRVSLPSQLSPRNLPALSDLGRSKYTIYSTPADLETIMSSASFRTLCEVMPVDLVKMTPSEIESRKPYEVMTAAHTEAIRRANLLDQPLIFSGPDAIFSDGTMATVDRLAKAGKRTVMVASYRVAKESYLAAYEERYRPDKKGVAVAPPRKLVEMSLSRLHPLSEAFLWDSPDYHRMPAHMYWRVGGEGLLLRCYHIHPIMVWPQDKSVVPVSTIDGKFVSLACPKWEDVATVEDSDAMFIPELSPARHELLMQPVLPNGARYLEFLKLSTNLRNQMSMKAVAVANWAIQRTDEYHRRYVRVKYRCHAGERNAALWNQVEAESDEALAQVEEWCTGNVSIRLPELFNCTPAESQRRMAALALAG